MIFKNLGIPLTVGILVVDIQDRKILALRFERRGEDVLLKEKESIDSEESVGVLKKWLVPIVPVMVGEAVIHLSKAEGAGSFDSGWITTGLKDGSRSGVRSGDLRNVFQQFRLDKLILETPIIGHEFWKDRFSEWDLSIDPEEYYPSNENFVYTDGTESMSFGEFTGLLAASDFFASHSSVISMGKKYPYQLNFMLQRAFRRYGVFLLVVWFVFLAVGTYLNAVLQGEVEAVQSEYGLLAQQVRNEIGLDKLVTSDPSGRTSSAPMSYVPGTSTRCMASILSIIPQNVMITGWDYQPLSRPIRDGADIELDLEVIRIKGVARELGAISDWVNQIKEYPWISDAQIGFVESSDDGLKYELVLRCGSSGTK